MKSQLKISLISVTLFFSFSTYGQKIDSLQNKTSYHIPEYKPLKVKNIIIPAAFIAYGFSAPKIKPLRKLDFDTNDELREDHPGFGFHADDYLRYVPIAMVYGLDLAGVKSKHKFVDRTALMLLSYGIMGATTSITKSATHRLRPDKSNYQSFPSGHAATAFMAAEFMHQEYKDQSIWYSVMGYSVAVATGTLRLYNDKHWFSDVVAGAGFGIISTKVSYWVYPYIKDKLFHGKANQNTVLVPLYQDGHTGLTYVRRF